MTGALDRQLAADMGRFFDDPLGFVMYAYPWDRDPSLQLVELPMPWAERYRSFYGPDRWACEFLEKIGRLVREHGFKPGGPAVEAIREAIVSGHGIGKSAMVGWLTDWIMSTRPFSKGTVTANTSKQLETKTWAQIAFWTRKCVTGRWFRVSTGRGNMTMRHHEHADDWYCTAQTCDVENSEAFAGQHAANATSFYIFDEASGIDDEIDRVSEGGLTDGEPMKFAFGNGTQNTGWFHRIFNSATGRKRWGRTHIDSREVQITNKKTLQEWIDDYGLDSDFVKVRVRGMFPSMSVKQFISTVDADAARGRNIPPRMYQFAPKVLTLDNSWEGDDEGVIGLRQGLVFKILRTFPKNDNDLDVAHLLAQLEDEHEADAVHIDAGYGTGVYSAGKSWNRDWKLVWFSAESPDPGCLNLRSYMWREMRDWMKQGGAIPDDQVLYDDLIGPQTVPRPDGKIQIEAKKDMKKRDVASPNRADALALSFAYPVAKKVRGLAGQVKAQQSGKRDHNPYENIGAKSNVRTRITQYRGWPTRWQHDQEGDEAARNACAGHHARADGARASAGDAGRQSA